MLFVSVGVRKEYLDGESKRRHGYRWEEGETEP